VAWVLAMPALFRAGLEVTFSRLCPSEGCHCLEPGARAARGSYVAWVLAMPALFQAVLEATFSRLYPSEGGIYPELGVRAARGFSLLCKGPGH
jgi:hypothetical protein